MGMHISFNTGENGQLSLTEQTALRALADALTGKADGETVARAKVTVVDDEPAETSSSSAKKTTTAKKTTSTRRAAVKPDPEPEPEETDEPEEDEDLIGGDDAAPTHADAVELGTELVAQERQPELKKILTDCGVKRMSELKGDDDGIAKFVAAARKALAGS